MSIIIIIIIIRAMSKYTFALSVVRCSSLRACWSISAVEHCARSSQEPQSDSYNFHGRHLKSYLFSQYRFRIERVWGVIT